MRSLRALALADVRAKREHLERFLKVVRRLRVVAENVDREGPLALADAAKAGQEAHDLLEAHPELLEELGARGLATKDLEDACRRVAARLRALRGR